MRTIRYQPWSRAANTACSNLYQGTPVTTALAAGSFVWSNFVNSGDIAIAAMRSNNSEEYLFADASAGSLTLTAPAGNLDLKDTAHDKPVRLRSQTFTGTLSGSIIGFQAKPGAGANASASVIGCEVSPRISNTFTGTTIIGGHFDCYLKGTTGDLSGDVRGVQIELVTDDAGTRTITGNVNGIRMRMAFSGTVSSLISAIRVEKAESLNGPALGIK